MLKITIKEQQKSNIQFGIALHIKECLLYDVSNIPFSFKFDETTTCKVDKQYDVYMQYCSKKSSIVSNRYFCSLFVGHCTNENLLEHFDHFVKEMHCDHSFLFHLGMNGPSVNLAFKKRLQVQLFEENSTFLDVSTFALHTIHNEFSKGIRVINFDIELFIVDVNSFKLSSGRREDYSKLEEVTELLPHFSLKHASSRWVTMKKITVRILEQ